MLSREAESLYWLGRYLERAEATARRFDVEYHSRLESEFASSATLPWHALLFSGGDESAFRERYPERDEAAVLTFLVLDGENPNSIRACVTAARENARGIREEISSEIWEHLNRFYLELLEQTAETVLARTPYDLLRWVRSSCWLFDGIAERTMIRGEGWHFLQCGKFLERAESTARLLDGKYYAGAEGVVGPPGLVDLYQWIALLKSVGAYEAFRKTRVSLQPSAIAAYVLLDARFPSAIRYALARVEAALLRLQIADRGLQIGEEPSFNLQSAIDNPQSNEALRAAGRLLSRLVHSPPPEVVAGLHETLTDLVNDCGGLHQAIVRTYFSHLAWRPWDGEGEEATLPAPADWQAMVSAQ
jgi:uncharacterized alpha-E superfamily protein